jgi:hypothetical protein
VDGIQPITTASGKRVYGYGYKDGCIDYDEIEDAKRAFLSPLENFLAKLEPKEKIMRNCDFDMAEEDKLGKMHCISKEDMIRSNKTCLATQARLDKVDKYVCTRAMAHETGLHVDE